MPAVSDVDDGVDAFNKTIRGVVIAQIAGHYVCIAVRVNGEVREDQIMVRS